MLWLLPLDILLPPGVRPRKLSIRKSSQSCLPSLVYGWCTDFKFIRLWHSSHSPWFGARAPPCHPGTRSLTSAPPPRLSQDQVWFHFSISLTLCWKSLLYPFFPSYLLDTCLLHFLIESNTLTVKTQTKQLFLCQGILGQASHNPALGFAKCRSSSGWTKMHNWTTCLASRKAIWSWSSFLLPLSTLVWELAQECPGLGRAHWQHLAQMTAQESGKRAEQTSSRRRGTPWDLKSQHCKRACSLWIASLTSFSSGPRSLFKPSLSRHQPFFALTFLQCPRAHPFVLDNATDIPFYVFLLLDRTLFKSIPTSPF